MHPKLTVNQTMPKPGIFSNGRSSNNRPCQSPYSHAASSAIDEAEKQFSRTQPPGSRSRQMQMALADTGIFAGTGIRIPTDESSSITICRLQGMPYRLDIESATPEPEDIQNFPSRQANYDLSWYPGTRTSRYGSDGSIPPIDGHDPEIELSDLEPGAANGGISDNISESGRESGLRARLALVKTANAGHSRHGGRAMYLPLGLMSPKGDQIQRGREVSPSRTQAEARWFISTPTSYPLGGCGATYGPVSPNDLTRPAGAPERHDATVANQRSCPVGIFPSTSVVTPQLPAAATSEGQAMSHIHDRLISNDPQPHEIGNSTPSASGGGSESEPDESMDRFIDNIYERIFSHRWAPAEDHQPARSTVAPSLIHHDPFMQLTRSTEVPDKSAQSTPLLSTS